MCGPPPFMELRVLTSSMGRCSCTGSNTIAPSLLKIEREHLRTDLKCDIAACKAKRVPAQQRIPGRLPWPARLIDHLSACPSERHLISARASPQETVRRLCCLPSRFWFLVVFGVTNQGVACWWQVLFSAFGFGTVLRAELQIACIPCFAICSVGVICF